MSKSRALVLIPETEFAHSEGRLWLARLCGLATGRQGEDSGPTRTQGMALLQAGGRRYEGSDLALDTCEQQKHVVRCHWRVGDSTLRLTTAWRGCPDTGVVSRRDTLTNAGGQPVVVSRCLARVALPPGRYECYTQTSRWCHENQGAWQPLHTGLTLRHAPGRTTEETTPYLALRTAGSTAGIADGLAFHVLPCGNWTIRVGSVNEGGDLSYAVVELGLADENLHLTLQPGETLELPEILIQPLPQGQPHLAAPGLHRYLLENHFADSKPQAPVVYNTWFDQFEVLDVPRLRKQLAAAKSVGCEVFVIDAGWYGAGGQNWWAQAGDWREKTEAAFHGKMRAFAGEVRAAGLKFGLWMEPERFGPDAPVRTEHPEWFISAGGSARMDLTLPAAYAWLRNEIGRLVKTYKLGWMKIDFNFTLDADASGAELSGYTTAWYRLLDEVRAIYPKTFFEGCSSGAMRGDLAMLTHVDGHFLSDSVNPVDMLRISQGAFLRLPPGRLTRWAVLRSAGQVLPKYGKSVANSPPALVTPCCAIWEPAETVDLDFALLAAMPGMLGFSGDLAGLPDAVRVRLAEHVRVFKRHRRFIVGAVAHLLTPPVSLAARDGWVGFQLQDVEGTDSLVFVYRIGVAGLTRPWMLKDLDPNGVYSVTPGLGGPARRIGGRELMEQGLTITVPGGGSFDRTNGAAMVTVRLV
ncbi:MAG: alpha-galactosidase [bacterium]